MLIRRKVFSLFEDENGEEKYFSTTEFDLDFEDRYFSRKEESEEEIKESNKRRKHADDEMKVGDDLGIWAHKHLSRKKDREALVKGVRTGKWHDYGKRTAKWGSAGGAIGGAISGAKAGARKKGVLGAIGGGLIGAAGGSAIGSAYGYIGGRLTGVGNNVGSKLSRSHAETMAREADRAEVANGTMSEKEYLRRRTKRND